MRDLDGRQVLLVEDEYLIALDLRHALEDAGAVVIGPEPSVQRALRRVAGETKIHAAVLDINLGGEQVFPVADTLTDRRIPFVFSTGYGDEVLSDRYPGVARCDKPLNMRLLIKTLEAMTCERG